MLMLLKIFQINLKRWRIFTKSARNFTPTKVLKGMKYTGTPSEPFNVCSLQKAEYARKHTNEMLLISSQKLDTYNSFTRC